MLKLWAKNQTFFWHSHVSAHFLQFLRFMQRSKTFDKKIGFLKIGPAILERVSRTVVLFLRFVCNKFIQVFETLMGFYHVENSLGIQLTEEPAN